MRMVKTQFKNGFSLIELMIAVVIIGILTAIAIPSYQAHVITANRTAAQSALVQLAATMERFHVMNNTYVGMANAAGVPTAAWFPATAPLGQNNNQTYTLTIPAANLTANTYRIEATPIAGTVVATDLSFSLDNAGAKQRRVNGAALWVNDWN